MAKIVNNSISFDEQEFMALYNASGTRQGLIDALEEMRVAISARMMQSSRPLPNPASKSSRP